LAWYILYQLLSILELLIVVRVVMSWVASPVSRNPFVQFVRGVTDPILEPIRSILPRTGPFDFAPMVALFLIYLVQQMIAR
jgi:YggT family protein